ncbi:MAG TPA: tetratricopeptide repeat protein [Burkholderiaceae bacterium]|jgi:hypothetical protein
MDSLDVLLKAAFVHHREARFDEAESLYRQILEMDSRQRHALSMLGMILMNDSRKAEAEAMFLRHLNVELNDPMTLHSLGRLLQDKGRDQEAVAVFRQAAVGKPDLAPIFNDMAVSLHRLGQLDEALKALDNALKVDPTFGVAHDNRGRVLYDSHRFLEAVEAHLTALNHTTPIAGADRMSILLHVADAAYEAREFQLAESACRAVLEMEEGNADAMEHLTKILYRLRRDKDAISLLNQRARRQGLIRKGRAEHPEATVLVLGAVGASHVPTRYLFDPERFGTLTLTLLSDDLPDAPLGSVDFNELTQVDLIFNTLGEVERDGGRIESVQRLATRLGKPILNPPGRVACTGRDQATALYGNITGLLVPKVRWMMRDEPIDDAIFSSPFLIRPGGTHGGEDLALIKTYADLSAYLVTVTYDRFLLTDFHDFKGAQNCYRKYRFIFVDRKPYPYHLAISESWLVHYWRTDMEYTDWKKQEEETFLNDWRGVFGSDAITAVEKVAQRMDLDYGGLDCSILPTGEVLFFEANACMLVHLDDAKEHFPYKHIAVPRIRDAITSMVRNRISRRENKE